MTKKKTSAPAQVAPKKKRVWYEGGPQDAAKEQERRLRGLPGYKKMTGLERFRAGLSVSDEMKQEDLKRRIPDEAERAAYNKKENERKENIKKRCEELSREFRVACYDTGLGDALEREGEIKAVMLAAHKLEIPEGGSNLTGGQLFAVLKDAREKKNGSSVSTLPVVVLSKSQKAILHAVASAQKAGGNRRVSQAEITSSAEAENNNDKRVGERTIKTQLPKLEKMKLVDRAEGKRNGWAVTSTGMLALAPT